MEPILKRRKLELTNPDKIIDLNLWFTAHLTALCHSSTVMVSSNKKWREIMRLMARNIYLGRQKFVGVLYLIHFDAFKWTWAKTYLILIELGCFSYRIDAEVINRHMTDQYHQFHPFHATRCALDISCFTFLNIVNVSLDVSLTQNALNDLSIVFFLHFLVEIAKLPEMVSFVIFDGLLYL